MEWLTFALALAIAIVALLGRAARVPRPRAWTLALVSTGLAIGLALRWRAPRDELLPVLPAPVEEGGFVTSDRCRACHPDQFASWHRSFHRTMTQRATPGAVLGTFDVKLSDRGRSYGLERSGDAYWVELVDPTWDLSGRSKSGDAHVPPPRVRERVLMTTGSHHLQAYWIKLAQSDGSFFQLPWLWIVKDRRWIPAVDSFLQPPPEGPLPSEVWNSTCIDCHTVGGQPRIRLDSNTFFSRAVELGIACESCHGPAEEHARKNMSPQRRYGLHLSGEPDPTIVNPARLSPRRASQVCGQCHSVNGARDMPSWFTEGRTYRAGDALDETRVVVRYSEHPTDPLIQAWLRVEPEGLTSRFWRDGTVRVAGRDYNGLIESACHQRGDLSCLSCHSMHESDPDDQLARGMESDGACLQCHESLRERVSEHTHHAEASGGSRCYNCHMPFTTWGLFTAMRSHRIDSPSAEASSRTGRPNACNLCHQDQTLAWTARQLSEWYGTSSATLPAEDSELAASLAWLLRGDAAQRAIAAWSMGWSEALAASGRSWQAPHLAQLLEDPYAAVRYVAGESLEKLPGFEGFEYDFLAPEKARSEARIRAVEAWERRAQPLDRSGAHLLLEPNGDLRQAELDRVMARRDDRPVSIIE